MSIWFRGAVFERAWYAGKKVGAAVEERFCALCDEERGSGGGMFENGRKNSLCWSGSIGLYCLVLHIATLDVVMGGKGSLEVIRLHKKFDVPGFLHKLHNYPADVRGTST